MNALKISESASLGFHAMYYLSENPKGHESGPSIAKSLGVSSAHLAKVLMRLVHGGLLKPVRGAKGGYQLAKAPDRINLQEVYEAIEGRLILCDCLLGRARCPRKQCLLGGLLKNVNHEVRDYLSQTTLADLVRENREK